MTARILTLALALLLPLALPPGGAQGTTPCDATQATHGYAATLAPFLVLKGVGDPGDLSDPADPACHGDDGDPESGTASGRFPTDFMNPLACSHATPTVAHHASGPGAEYRAADNLASVAYAAVADGALAVDPWGIFCLGDGIASDADPADCAEGRLGLYDPASGTDRSATLAPSYGLDPSNPDANGNLIPGEPGPVPAGDEVTTSTCAPIDGFVNVFLSTGPVVDPDATFVSAFTTGSIWG